MAQIPPKQSLCLSKFVQVAAASTGVLLRDTCTSIMQARSARQMYSVPQDSCVSLCDDHQAVEAIRFIPVGPLAGAWVASRVRLT